MSRLKLEPTLDTGAVLRVRPRSRRRRKVASIPVTIAALKANDIAISQGPVSFGESGHVSVFVRDPDLNVIELRGRDQGEVEGVTRYVP